MSREIKFRAWIIDKKIMSEPFNLEELVHKNFPELYFFGKKGYPVMQFTGLKDVKGKEIYEGDIVDNPGKEDPRNRRVVYYDDKLAMFKIRSQNGDNDLWDGIWVSGMEVIGNIYENPELVEKR